MARKAHVAQALVLSLLAHGALGAAVWAAMGHWQSAPAVQHVMVAKMVRLGPARAKELLPERAPPAPAAAAPLDAAAAPAAPATPTPAAKAPESRKAPRPALGAARSTRAALERLKQRAQGSPDGSVDGDAEVAEAGDAYAAVIRTCLKSNFVIEGVDAAQVAGSRALLLLYVQADGRITRHKLLETSGKPAVDAAVRRALQRCAKIAPPPAILQSMLRNEGIQFEFHP